MKKSLISIITASAIVLAGCGSTTKTVNPDLVSNETPPAMPESYQTMIDFGIIDKYEANQVVNGQREALSNNLGEFRESALGQLTDGGDMFIGFAIAQLFGGGVALTDFFNPLAYTGAIRTSIPALSGHPFRFNPDTDSGISQPVFC